MAKKPAGFKTAPRKSADDFIAAAGSDPFGDRPASTKSAPASPASAEEAWRFADPEETARLVFNLRLNTLENGALEDIAASERMSKQQVIKSILIPELFRLAGVEVEKK